MKTLLAELRASLLLTTMLALLLCGAYPLAVWAGAQWLFPEKANGSLLLDEKGVVTGSRLIGQPFTSTGYFASRPSSAGTGYDAANSSGSNLGPTNRKLLDTVEASVLAYRLRNGIPDTTAVPADAVTASASGLDPHISMENARLQVPRVAHERGLSLTVVMKLVEDFTSDRDLGVFGEPGVNVLLLNRSLDRLVSPGRRSDLDAGLDPATILTKRP